MINLISKKIKPLFFIFIISCIFAFGLSLVYPIKKSCFCLIKSFIFEPSIKMNSENIGYFNYEKKDNAFVATDKDSFLFIDNINSFVRNIEIKLQKPLDKNISLKLFIYDIATNKNLLIFETVNDNFESLKIEMYKKIKNIIMTVGDNIGDKFYFDSITINDNTIWLNEIKNYDYFSQTGNINFWIRYLILFFFFIFCGLHFIFDITFLYKQIYKYKYIIGLAIVLFAVIFELNNSSVDFWRFSNQESDIIFGEARFIRSDEYAVYTPMLLSQSPDYNYYNDLLRGTKTDMFMVYGQPVKNIVCLFRPFLLGFIFFGSAKGLSFFWIVRLIFLFFITFEFLMLTTRQNKKLSLLGSVLITFAPVVQWWWTPSGIVEIIIYGELLVILLNNYFIQKKFIKRMLELFIIMMLLGSYILVLYPAWQIPFAYIFAVSFLCICFENYKNYKFYKKDIVPVLLFIALLMLTAVYIYDKSKEAIDLITQTAYPGSRFETGGDTSFINVFKYWGNIFFTFTEDNLKTNTCAFSVFFDFFPIGLILSFIVLFKDKIKDKILILLLCLYLFFVVWCVIGVPKIIAQITFMKVSPAYRTFAILGYLNILILLRSLSLKKYKIGVLMSGIVSLCLTIITVYSNILIYEKYFNLFKISFTALLCFSTFYLMLRNKINKIFITLTILIIFVAGGLVNPVQKGIDVIKNFELYKAIKNINMKDKGLWITEGDIVMFWYRNLPIMAGASSFNSTNTYPNLNFFRKLDKENKYEHVYNRYANIGINLVKNDSDEKFLLKQEDVFFINLTVTDIEELGIKYILTSRDLEEFSNDKILFKKIFYSCTNNLKFYIYEIKNTKEENLR